METRKQTVLIVDETPADIEMLGEAINGECEVLFATNGQEALNLAIDQSPDLILLDIILPEMDGYEVCTRLKQDARTQDIPVIFVTAMEQEEDEAKGLNVGAIDYLPKPLRPPIIRARVRNYLELKRYRDFTEILSFTDVLTGVFNRRRFDETLDREWRRARRSQNPLSLIFVDIDRFKSFNDHYGRLAGDDFLRRLARILSDCVRRPSDLVARYEGDEFACLLPETDNEGAIWVDKQIRDRLNNLNIPHAHSAVTDHVTLSLGVATLVPLVGQPLCDLIRRADESLFAAKRNGRSQVR